MRRSTKSFSILLMCIAITALFFYYSENVVIKSKAKSTTCGRFPDEVFVDNVIWQVLETSKGRISLLNAYLETRFDKIVVLINSNGPDFKKSHKNLHCQFWFEGETENPLIVQVSEFRTLWPAEYATPLNKNFPYFLVCPLKAGTKLPLSVSLVVNACDNAENNLKIIDNQPLDGVKKEFGVCTKQMTYTSRDFVIRFIEWVHMLRILGAEKIHGYNRLVHPDLFKTINYFEDKDFVEIKPFLEPSGTKHELHSWQTRTLEMNLLNDCFYRTKSLYKYLAVIDVDEVILPSKETDLSWHDILANIHEAEKRDFFFIPWFYFPHNKTVPRIDGIPDYYYMLQHVQRETPFHFFDENAPGFKSIYNTDKVLTINHHIATSCRGVKCNGYRMPENISYVGHYRDSNRWLTGVVHDTTVWKFKEQLMKTVHATLRDLKYHP